MPFLHLKPGQLWRRGLVGSFAHPPLTSSSLLCDNDTIPTSCGSWGIFLTVQPFESLLHNGAGWSRGTLTLGPGRLELASRRDREPHFPAPPILHAPVPEAAVWVTSSHKHALFLRKWKVSEVWWGAGCLQQQHLGLPLSYSLLRRDPTGAPGAPTFSAFTTLASNPGNPGKVGRGSLSRCRGLCRARTGTWQEKQDTALSVCLHFLPPPWASRFFPFFSLWLAKG